MSPGFTDKTSLLAPHVIFRDNDKANNMVYYAELLNVDAAVLVTWALCHA